MDLSFIDHQELINNKVSIDAQFFNDVKKM